MQMKPALQVWVRVWKLFYLHQWKLTFPFLAPAERWALQPHTEPLLNSPSFTMWLLLSKCRNMKGSAFFIWSVLHSSERRDKTVNAAFTGESTSGCTTVINHLSKVTIQHKNRFLSIYNVNYKCSYLYALIGFCIHRILNLRTFMLKSMHNTSCNLALINLNINAPPPFFFFT